MYKLYIKHVDLCRRRHSFPTRRSSDLYSSACPRAGTPLSSPLTPPIPALRRHGAFLPPPLPSPRSHGALLPLPFPALRKPRAILLSPPLPAFEHINAAHLHLRKSMQPHLHPKMSVQPCLHTRTLVNLPASVSLTCQSPRLISSSTCYCQAPSLIAVWLSHHGAACAPLKTAEMFERK